MVEKYFAIKVVLTYFAAGVAALAVSVFIARVALESIKQNRKTTLLRKNGYEREMYGVPSVGDGAFYWWVKDGESPIREHELQHMSYRRLKEQIGRKKENKQ